MRYDIFTRGDNRSLTIAEALARRLDATNDYERSSDPNIVIFIGGDGTFLRAIQHYLTRLGAIIFVGIHTGTLGFFCDYHEKEIDQLIRDLPKAESLAHQYRLLKLTRHYDKGSDEYLAVNEVRLENPFHTLVSDVEIDGVLLETFRGNGLIVASTLGSSAYNKSLGGALITTSLETMQLTEVATLQNNAFRSLGSSLVLDGNQTITLRGQFDKAVIGYDHCVLQAKQGIHALDITLSDRTVSIIHQNNRIYPEILRRSFIKDQ